MSSFWIHKSEAHKYISRSHVEKGVKLYEFKVKLLETRPLVWRQIVVSADFTLEQLGRVAACAIGWIPRCTNFWGRDGKYIMGHNPFSRFLDSDSETDEPEKSN